MDQCTGKTRRAAVAAAAVAVAGVAATVVAAEAAGAAVATLCSRDEVCHTSSC